MTRTVNRRKMREIRAVADAVSESIMAVEMAARERQAKELEAKTTMSKHK